MTIETVTCARCDGRVPKDVDHAEVEVESVRMEDRNRTKSYALCSDCELKLKDEWSDPV